MKAIYRKPLDAFEQYSTGAADVILVNSSFTKKVFRETFPALESCSVDILYPALETKKFSTIQTTSEKVNLPHDALLVSSVNRYERKKVRS